MFAWRDQHVSNSGKLNESKAQVSFASTCLCDVTAFRDGKRLSMWIPLGVVLCGEMVGNICDIRWCHPRVRIIYMPLLPLSASKLTLLYLIL